MRRLINSLLRRRWRRALQATCELKVRDCLPLLAVLTVTFNAVGYYYGFVQFRLVTSRPASDGGGRLTFDDERSTDRPVYERNGGTPEPDHNRTPQPARIVRSKHCNVTSHSDRRKKDGRWFNYGVLGFQFYAYSAILDDRASLNSTRPVVRIIAVSSSRYNVKPETNDPQPVNKSMSCRLYYSGAAADHEQNSTGVEIVEMVSEALPVGWGWWLNKEMVREYIFTCPLPAARGNDLPVAVDVLVDSDVTSSVQSVNNCMPVDYPEKPPVKLNLAICVQIAYNRLNALRLIEWLELQRLLGVDMVAIYNMSIFNGPAHDVLLYYSQTATSSASRQPFVDLRRSDFIPTGPSQHLLQGSPVINDCIYRHMHRFKHIAVIDFDEAIIPRGNVRDLNQLVGELKQRFSFRPNSPVNYIFANNYYFMDAPKLRRTTMRPTTTTVAAAGSTNLDDVLNAQLTVLKYQIKAPASEYGHAVKSIINPQACLRMHNHYCWSVTELYKERGEITVIDPSIAVNQHYKPCHLNRTACQQQFQRSTFDDVMNKYRRQIVSNVRDKITSIFRGDSHEILNRLLNDDLY